jgi:hypothetical protein
MQEERRATSIADSAVKKTTGKGWDEWFAILDEVGGKAMNHKELVAALNARHPNVSGWWQQSIVVAYEQERALHEKHQTPEGYQGSASKTIDAPIAALYKAWEDDDVRERWLTEPIEVRRATPNKSLRITWVDGTNVDVNLYAKGDAKSQVTLQHSKLRDADEVAAAKSYWSEALERLRLLLES